MRLWMLCKHEREEKDIGFHESQETSKEMEKKSKE